MEPWRVVLEGVLRNASLIPVSKAISVRGGGVGRRQDSNEHVGTKCTGTITNIFASEDSFIFLRCSYFTMITIDNYRLQIETIINNGNCCADQDNNINLCYTTRMVHYRRYALPYFLKYFLYYWSSRRY